MTTMGKFRHLSRCSTDDGHFTVLAIDHRTNLLEKLNQFAAHSLNDADFTDFKEQVVSPLLTEASALLIDPAYGIGAGIAGQIINRNAGLLSPIEVTNYDLPPGKRDVEFIPEWSVAKIKRVGADGVKMLLPYHPEANNIQQKHDIVQQIVADCEKYDIPFFLEPIAYSLNTNEKMSNNELRQIVVQMASTFSKMGVDILKLQFPVDASQSADEKLWQAACEEVDAACAVPWALLSAGVGYDVFERQAQIACEAGASGVIVGRAVWAEAVELQGNERQHFLDTTAKTRMTTLAKICANAATPWYERVTLPDASINWYESYQSL